MTEVSASDLKLMQETIWEVVNSHELRPYTTSRTLRHKNSLNQTQRKPGHFIDTGGKMLWVSTYKQIR